MKLLVKYESVTQIVLLSVESILQDAKQLQHARLSFQAIFSFPPSVVQHLRCNSFDCSKTSELQFIERGHRVL
jgi:hypothetical protein